MPTCAWGSRREGARTWLGGSLAQARGARRAAFKTRAAFDGERNCRVGAYGANVPRPVFPRTIFEALAAATLVAACASTHFDGHVFRKGDVAFRLQQVP